MIKVPKLCLLCTPENSDSPLDGSLLLQILNNTEFDIWLTITKAKGSEWASSIVNNPHVINSGDSHKLISTSIREIQEETTLIFKVKTITDKGDITNTKKLSFRPKSLIKPGVYQHIEGLDGVEKSKILELPYSIMHSHNDWTVEDRLSKNLQKRDKIRTAKPKPITRWETIELDLHWNKIDVKDKYRYVTAHEILQCQLRFFESRLNEELKKGTYELEINVGRSGVKLKSEVIQILNRRGIKHRRRLDNEPSVLLTTLRAKI